MLTMFMRSVENGTIIRIRYVIRKKIYAAVMMMMCAIRMRYAVSRMMYAAIGSRYEIRIIIVAVSMMSVSVSARSIILLFL